MSFSKRQYTLFATALGSSLAFIDATAVIVALPTIQKALKLGLNGEQWVFLSYSLALAALYLIGGALGDRYGHRKMFARGVVGFAIASILAGLAPNGIWLISARILQGISGAFVTTNSLAWLRAVFAEHAGKAVGLWTSLTGISTIIAPPLGGAFTQWLSWRWIFYINIPLACLVLYWSARAVEDKEREDIPRPLDFPGAVLIAIGFSFLTYYLVQGAKSGFASLWWALVIGLGGLVTFVWVEMKSKHPVVPLELFKIRNFTFSNLETFLIYGALNGIFVYFTLYLQFLGLKPLQSSLFLVPTSVVLIFLATYFGMLSDKVGPKKMLIAAPALIGVSTLIFASINSRDDIWLRGGIGIAFFSLGLAMLVAPITATALKAVPSKYAGLATGINTTFSRTGNLVAVAIIGMVISVVFFNQISDKTAVPLGLHQSTPALIAASKHSYHVGMVIVACLAFAASATAWFGISNSQLEK